MDSHEKYRLCAQPYAFSVQMQSCRPYRIYIYIYIYIYTYTHTLIYIYIPNPSTHAENDTRSIFKWSLKGLILMFSFSQTRCYTKVKDYSLPYYFSITGNRKLGFILFPRVLELCEMQTALSRF